MELVNVCLFAEGYYSGSTYEDNIWIKKSSYEKLKDIFPTEIGCGELDGKFSEVMGDVEIQDDWETDVDYAQALIDLSTQSMVHQLSLQVGAKLIQPTLMDFLN